MLLRRCLDVGLGDDVHVIFSNTGKELEETYVFIDRVSREWNVPIVWLERMTGGAIREVTFETASRKGEPFKALIVERNYMPNPVARICTEHLKVRVSKRWAIDRGWDHWTSVVGMRADEPKRVASTRAQVGPWDAVCPLADAGITKADVMAFWAAHPFDLELRSWEGNCDLCYLKSTAKRERIIRDRPNTPDWWIEAETLVNTTNGKPVSFRSSGPKYAEIKRRASLPMFNFDPPSDDIDDLGDCGCHD